VTKKKEVLHTASALKKTSFVFVERESIGGGGRRKENCNERSPQSTSTGEGLLIGGRKHESPGEATFFSRGEGGGRGSFPREFRFFFIRRGKNWVKGEMSTHSWWKTEGGGSSLHLGGRSSVYKLSEGEKDRRRKYGGGKKERSIGQRSRRKKNSSLYRYMKRGMEISEKRIPKPSKTKADSLLDEEERRRGGGGGKTPRSCNHCRVSQFSDSLRKESDNFERRGATQVSRRLKIKKKEKDGSVKEKEFLSTKG